MYELKRCPCCGHEASIDMDDNGYFYVGCDERADCPRNVFKTREFYETEKEAVEAWNAKEAGVILVRTLRG